jgi:hypothetical protein
MRAGRVVANLSATLVLVALLGLAAVTGPDTGPDTGPARAARTSAPLTLPVTAVTLVCAPSPHQDSMTSTRTIVASATAGAGTVTVQPLDRSGPPIPLQLTTAANAVPVGTATEKALVIRGDGPVSTGLTAVRVTRSGESAVRGLQADRCVSPRTQWWFNGVSTAAGVASVLRLSNAEDTEAGVTVTALSDKGRLESPITRGLLLPPHTTQDVPMENLAPGVAAMAVQVLTTRGRVAAAVSENRTPVPKPQGADDVPAQPAPQASLVIPGVPGDGSDSVISGAKITKVLRIGVPGTQDATVHVEITDAGGRFLPVGADTVTVPAGTVVTVALDGVVGAKSVVVRVYSEDYVPIVAGVFVSAAAKFGDYRETLHLGPVAALTGPAIVGDFRTAPGLDSRLVLTAYTRGSTGVTLLPAGGAPRHIELPAQRTVIVKASQLGIRDSTAVTVVPDKGSSNIYAAVVLEELGFSGPLIGGYGLSGGLGSVTLPPARADLRLPLIDAR